MSAGAGARTSATIGCFPHSLLTPDEVSVTLALRDCLPLWNAMASFLGETVGAAGTWKSYGPQYGWRLDFRRKGKGPLAGLYPQRGYFVAAFNLLQDEWPAAFSLGLDPAVHRILEASEPLQDGRFMLIPVTGARIAEDVRALVGLKLPGKRAR